ncbi:MAG TPA: mechanosensitive ion channel domain-containing protein [Longimicrobiaceae bacterium]|nr:mechanosensitive ion channel domain-containing protein [Longimicrobiaceae bacterium]
MLQVDSVIAVTTGRIRAWSDLFNWPALAASGLRVLGALAVAVLAFWALNAVLRRVERSIGDQEPGGVLSLHEQRARTLVGLLRSIGRVVIFTITVFMVLGAVGVQLGPLLAGAGVVGLAISFGAQSLVKDVISGLFILIEDQFGVGDVIRVEGVSGAVERMSLRVVVLRDVEGVVHTVPNGQITKVSNFTRSWARVVMDVSVSYHEEPDRVMEVIRAVGSELWEDPDWHPLLVEPLEVLGIEEFGEGSYKLRVMAKTLPLKKTDVARELRRRLKLRFEHEGIEVPVPSQALYWAEGSERSALAPLGGGGARDGLAPQDGEGDE